MHIILRYEMERALIRGDLAVEDVSVGSSMGCMLANRWLAGTHCTLLKERTVLAPVIRP